MILRKPYAVFIKYFKLLHVIMAAFIALILYRSVTLYNFFRTYSVDYRTAMGDFSVNRYLGVYSFAFVVIALILTIILLSVMFYKQKPKSLYIYNLILYILVIVLYSFCGSALRDVTSVILDVRTSKAIRDFALIAVILESISLILVAIRATGFDIKQFDFGSDLQQLDISEKDSEEIEVAIEFDKDETIRKFRSNLRNMRYVYVEHKFVINIVALFLIVIMSTILYLNVSIYTANYRQGQTFTASSVTVNVKDSYILDSDPIGNKLVETEGNNAGVIVVVRFQIKGYGVNKTFNTGLATLKIGDLSYSQSPSHAVELYDLGTAYIKQKITSEFQTYILAFEIPDSLAGKKMILKFNDNISFVKGEIGAKNILVKLKPQDLRKNGQTFEKKLTQTISFDESILGSSSLTINSFEVNNKFKLDYNYCYGTDKCINSYEYLTPTATGNYFKTLMKVSGEIIFDKNNNIKDINDLRTFLNNFGTINYKINDVWQSKKINSKAIKPRVAKTSDYYIEVPYELKDASEINFTFNVRNQSYKYVLK